MKTKTESPERLLTRRLREYVVKRLGDEAGLDKLSLADVLRVYKCVIDLDEQEAVGQRGRPRLMAAVAVLGKLEEGGRELPRAERRALVLAQMESEEAGNEPEV